ncbi:hypothetical protein QBC46DRAFT_408655 [Diplogelasinospora grovesii]|uniref:Uncharacterized protein n=1 Tax=Diplogelasinospora grovesii TaxID=303347 RepID=A0AAN6S3P8_9PEZI|nr:hypothetical protein QBC46DRAFT_408655 [Diplogelasinospora grovesii]
MRKSERRRARGESKPRQVGGDKKVDPGSYRPIANSGVTSPFCKPAPLSTNTVTGEHPRAPWGPNRPLSYTITCGGRREQTYPLALQLGAVDVADQWFSWMTSSVVSASIFCARSIFFSLTMRLCLVGGGHQPPENRLPEPAAWRDILDYLKPAGGAVVVAVVVLAVVAVMVITAALKRARPNEQAEERVELGDMREPPSVGSGAASSSRPFRVSWS